MIFADKKEYGIKRKEEKQGQRRLCTANGPNLPSTEMGRLRESIDLGEKPVQL